MRLTFALLRDTGSISANVRLADRLFELSRFDKACVLYRKAIELGGLDHE
jgi:hypothetical protein